MATVRNSFGEDRVAPTAGYVLIPDGGTVEVPDDQLPHWIAGGWTHVQDPPAKPAPAAPAPAAAPAEGVAA